MSTIIKKGFPHLIAVSIFLILSAVYFSPQIEGKRLSSYDEVSAYANLKEILDHKEATGETTMWTNALFSGMPAYQINSAQPSNMTKYFEKLSRGFIARPIGLFFAAMLVFYVMLVLMKVNPWLSIIGALAFGLTTNNYVLFGAGHVTKVKAIIHLGLVAAGVVMAFRKQYLMGGLVFALGLSLELLANHIQMTYYFFLTLGLYGLIELVRHIMNKDFASYGKAVLYLLIGGMLAIGASASKLWTTYEYGKDTMRGDPILAVDENVQRTSSNTSGLEYGYATRWSNGYMDLVAGFIPGVVGGGGVTYWGANDDGTAGPAYYGAVVFLLFIFGLLIVKGPIKWWLGGGVLLISLISMGKNMDWLYHTLYEYFPLFNKFRTPNSALSVVAFMVPILGILAVNDLIKGKVSKEEAIRALYIAGGVLLAFCLFYALMGGSYFDFTYLKDEAFNQNYGRNNPSFLRNLRAQRATMMAEDAWRSLALVLAGGALLWFYLKGRLNQTILLAGLGVLIVGDLWTVNQDYLSKDSFIDKRQYNNASAPREVDSRILEDKDPHYRVLDLSKGISNAVNSAIPSYHHKNIGGYHPAKLQRYQDMLDRHVLPECQQLLTQLPQASGISAASEFLRSTRALNMLNMKYLIVSDQQFIPNPYRLGNAWFVDRYQMVNTPNEEIDNVRNINPGEVAVVNQEFADQLSGLNIQKGGSIQLTKYAPNHITYTSNANSEQLALFSEVWYGPDKGWKAYVDNQPVDHIRANYILRGLRIPAGQHTIEFKFEPSSYYTGETISLLSSLLIIFSILGYVGYQFYQNKNVPPAKSKLKIADVPKPTRSKKRKK